MDTQPQVVKDDVIEALKMVEDPELKINVYDMGLIYDIAIVALTQVHIKMTLTAPNCPEAQSLPLKVRDMVKRAVPFVTDCTVEIVWEPPWTKDRMSEDARLASGIFF